MVPEGFVEKIEAWRESDRCHHYHPMTNPRQLNGEGCDTMMVRGEGIYLFDSDGERYIDGLSGLGCVNIGYGNQAVVDATTSAMQELPFVHTYGGATNPWVCQLSAKLAEVTPEGFEHFFFASSGSEAVESAVKMAWHYWHLRQRPDKRMIITRSNSYHGNTIFACSLTGIERYHPQFGLPLQTDLIGRVDGPYWWRHGGDLSPEAYGQKVAEEFERYVAEVGAGNIAAFIGEPLQGTAGTILPPPGYWAEINRICRDNDILVICDEVITGFGKTGKWFGCETFGIDADFLTMAKGLASAYLPQSAVAVGARAAEVLMDDDHDLIHGFTCNGHPVTAAAALANISVIEDLGLIDTVANELGPHFGAKLTALAEKWIVGEVRHCGVLAALEFSPDKASRAQFPADAKVGDSVAAAARERGLIVRPLGNTIGLSIPLITSSEEVNSLIEILTDAIQITASEL